MVEEREEKQNVFRDCVVCRIKCLSARMHELEDQMVLLAGFSAIAIVASVAALVISLVV